MEKYTKIAVVVVLCVLAASAGFMVASLPLGSKGPTDYSQPKPYPVYPEMCIEEETDIERSKGFPVPTAIPTSVGGGGTAESQYTGTDTERKIIQTASLNIEVEHFQSSFDAVMAIPSGVPHAVVTQDRSAKAIDAWSPVMEIYKDDTVD